MEGSVSHASGRGMAADAVVVQSGWWRCLFDQAEDPQVICLADGRAVELNRRAMQLLGVDPESCDPTTCLFDVLTPAVKRKLAASFQNRSPRPETIPAITLVCSGRLGMIADLQVQCFDEEHYLVTVKDASRRWRMESHVQRLITAVDSTRDVVYLTDNDFKITFVNAAFHTVTGYSVEDVLGRSADFLRAPSEAARVAEYHEKMTQTDGWVGELINRRSDGELYPVESSVSPIYDKRGGLLGYAAFERDITAKRRLQDALLLERDTVQSIINSLDAAVYTVNREFVLTHVSDGYRKLPASHGWLDSTVPPEIGHSLLDYVSDLGRRMELRDLFLNVLETRTPRAIETASADRSYHWLMKIAPWWHQGEIEGLIYSVTDHTYLHQLKNQLFQAQKMETIGALAAGVAHDFNNLLLAVRGNAGLVLLQEGLSDDTRKRLQNVEQAATRAGEITQQLLSFSRASDERETVLDFNEVVKEAVHFTRRSIRSNVKTRLDLPEMPIKVRMDATRAQQLLLNLCVNAQDAMPEGGQLVIRNQMVALPPALAAKVQQPAGTPFLCCSVSDSGTGIPPEVLNRIFDPFFTTKGSGKGTGLGLSIVQSVITKAKGTVEVDTALGKGTTFFLYLPLAQAGMPSQAPARDVTLQRGSGRVLVVDDLDLVLDFTRSFLSAAGYEVLTANSAEQAMELLARLPQPIDLLFTDYNMTGRNGCQLIREVTQRWPNVGAILVSGYLDDEQRAHVEKELGARILHKPFNMREAADLVAEVLSARS